MRILFIDDDAVFSNALSEMLEEQNIQVDQAECASGMNWRYDYQAIVLNLGLPDMTGSDFNELRKMATKRRFVCRSDRDEARLTA